MSRSDRQNGCCKAKLAGSRGAHVRRARYRRRPGRVVACVGSVARSGCV